MSNALPALKRVLRCLKTEQSPAERDVETLEDAVRAIESGDTDTARTVFGRGLKRGGQTGDHSTEAGRIAEVVGVLRLMERMNKTSALAEASDYFLVSVRTLRRHLDNPDYLAKAQKLLDAEKQPRQPEPSAQDDFKGTP